MREQSELLKEWKEANARECGIPFAPSDGKCWSCGIDLVKYWKETKRRSATGCPNCNASYCD